MVRRDRRKKKTLLKRPEDRSNSEGISARAAAPKHPLPVLQARRAALARLPPPATRNRVHCVCHGIRAMVTLTRNGVRHRPHRVTAAVNRQFGAGSLSQVRGSGSTGFCTKLASSSTGSASRACSGVLVGARCSCSPPTGVARKTSTTSSLRGRARSSSPTRRHPESAGRGRTALEARPILGRCLAAASTTRSRLGQLKERTMKAIVYPRVRFT
jgi:hypothetical protein